MGVLDHLRLGTSSCNQWQPLRKRPLRPCRSLSQKATPMANSSRAPCTSHMETDLPVGRLQAFLEAVSCRLGLVVAIRPHRVFIQAVAVAAGSMQA